MRVAVTADENKGIDSAIGYHFGRCPYYVFVNVENGKVAGAITIPNGGAGGHAPGELPLFIQQNGINTLLTGGMGSRAVDFFTQYGIEVVTGATGTVRQAVEQYLAGQLRGHAPCQQSQEHGRNHNH